MQKRKSRGQSLQSTLRRAWYWGMQEFRETLLDRLEKRKGTDELSRDYAGGEQGGDCSYRMAEQIIGEGVAHFELEEGTHEVFLSLKRGAVERVVIAWALVSQNHCSAEVDSAALRYEQRC